MKVKSIVNKLNIRESPDINSKILGQANLGAIIDVLDEDGDFYKMQHGWVAKKYTKEILNVHRRSKRSLNLMTDEPRLTRKEYEKTNIKSRGLVDGIKDYGSDIMSGISDNFNIFGGGESAEDAMYMIRDMSGIFALPPNFSAAADYRPDDFKYGTHYIQNILCDAALVSIVPGEPRFMPGVGEDEKTEMVKLLANTDTESAQSDMSKVQAMIADESYGRYYVFEKKCVEYYKYVDDLCGLAAKFLGIGDAGSDVLGTSYGRYKWANFKSSNRDEFFGGEAQDGFIAFYVDPSSDATESLTNNTKESMLAGMTKKASDVAKEGYFLLGTGAGKTLNSTAMDKTTFEEEVGSMDGLMGRLGSSSKVITNGGNLIFPEIWGDSDYDKSYSIQIKLQSPSGHVEDIFLNIIVPYIHLLCLTAPRQIMPNGYISPFIVRLFAKGWMNCDMGMVSSLTVKKGGSGDSWSIHGLPTEMEITMSIKDLYSSLSIANTENSALMLSNTGLIDHIGTLCGLNVHKPDISRRLATASALFLNGYKNIIPNKINSTYEYIKNLFDRGDALTGL